MTRSAAPFQGAHGEDRIAISPAASQADAEPCARAFHAPRARRNAPAISDNAVVAVPMTWRAESTGSPLPLSRPATQLAENHGKSRSVVLDHNVRFGLIATKSVHRHKMPLSCQKRTHAPQANDLHDQTRRRLTPVPALQSALAIW